MSVGSGGQSGVRPVAYSTIRLRAGAPIRAVAFRTSGQLGCRGIRPVDRPVGHELDRPIRHKSKGLWGFDVRPVVRDLVGMTHSRTVLWLCGRLSGYFLAWLADDPPFFHIPSPRPDRYEPAVLNQRFSQAHDVRWVSDTVGAVGADIPQGDSGFAPVIDHPGEELFVGRSLAMGRWNYRLRPSPYYFRLGGLFCFRLLSQTLKYVRHCRHPSLYPYP